MKLKMTLSIGLANATRSEVIEFDDTEVPTDQEEIEEWMNEMWKEWAWEHIDGSVDIVE